MVTGRVSIEPPRLFFAPGATAPLHVKLKKPAGTPLKILEVSANDQDFRATVTPVTEGREYDVSVTYTGAAGRGSINTRITVKTNEPGQDVIFIPVAGRV